MSQTNPKTRTLWSVLCQGFPWTHSEGRPEFFCAFIMSDKPEKIPYWELLKRPEWQRKRLEIMKRDNFTCLRCKDKDESLVVHHSYYISGRDPWMYPDFSLLTLCKSCHDREHENIGTQSWEEMLTEICGLDEFVEPDVMIYCMHMSNVLRPSFSQKEICMALLDGLMRLWDETHGTRPPLHINFNTSIIKHWAKSKYPDAPVTNKQFGQP